MKKIQNFLFIAAILISICGSSQTTDISTIPEALTERPWLDHSTHLLFGYKITKVFGERPAEQRHSNLGSITSMAYLDKAQLISELDSLDISSEEKEKRRQQFEDQAAGGAIRLFIARPSESRANFKWYFVVIRGTDDNEKIMEIDLDYQASQLPDANGWWNYTTVLLPQKPKLPFYVYVNDKQSQHLSDFKFKVDK